MNCGMESTDYPDANFIDDIRVSKDHKQHISGVVKKNSRKGSASWANQYARYKLCQNLSIGKQTKRIKYRRSIEVTPAIICQPGNSGL